ncbi:MAG TPA: sigma 54-interacting transcriptional regulator [Thermodesulfobacteriota bacterium]|nr:sigma 54-interacting transcriptional regulator [Thermodesulfobacteriota bacterium]
MKNRKPHPTLSEPPSVKLGIKDEHVPLHAHVAYFWETDKEFADAVGFLEAGLLGTDHCVIFGHDEANQAVFKILRKRGFDVEALQAKRRLTVLRGNSSGDAILQTIAATFEQAIAGGTPLVRLLGNIGWFKHNWPDQEDLLAFEAKVTDATKQFPCVVVCMYDMRGLPGHIVHHGGFETHPLIIREDSVHKNPYYVSTDMFLEHLEAVAADIAERQRTEETLRKTAHELRFLNDLIEQTNQPVAVSNLDGRLIRFNHAYEQLTGYSSKELHLMTYQEITPEPWHEFEAGQITSLMTEGIPVRYEKEYIRKDGTLVPVELIADIYRNAAGEPEYLYAFVTDITERKKAEESLKKSEERFRTLFESAPIGISINDANGKFVQVNKSFQEMLGYNEDELKEISFREVTLTEDLPESKRVFGELVQGKRKEFRIEKRYRRKNGSLMWANTNCSSVRDVNGNFIYTFAMVEDITERKRAEEALRGALSEVEQLKNRLQAENIYLQEEIKSEYNFEEIIGQSESLHKALRSVEKVASTDASVLIYGETGTGKELIARAIHNLSPRKDRPLVKVNCGAISAGLVESELFGHEKGAFTGALQRRIGRFELANGGTIFLDEVGELPLDTQVKLLRVLQEGEFERVGSSKPIKADVRVIAATNRDLSDAVKSGAFRSDLFYRLNVFPLEVPPLRERKADIPLLVNFFVTKFAKRLGKQVEGISKETMNKLVNYPWPGNIRELQNIIERAAVVSAGPTIQIDESVLGLNPVPETGVKETLEEVERTHIIRALEQTNWVIHGKQGAATILGINPNTLRSRMQKLGIKRPK